MIKNNSKVKELLISKVNIKELIDIVNPCNKLGNKEVKDFINLPFQKVMDILNILAKGDLLNSITYLTKLKEEQIMELNANEFVCFVKFLNNQSEHISMLMASLKVDDFDDSNMMLQASGIENLNKFGEAMIYYNITKNPTKWNKIGKMPFSYIFTKLSIDTEVSKINKSYSDLMKRKKQ